MKSLVVMLLVLCAAPCYGQISFGGRARQSSAHRYESQSLGTLNGSRYDSNSLSNKYGAGSRYKADGLNNQFSRYGSPYSNDSANNPYATNAPQIYSADGTYHGRLSANRFDPDSTSNQFGRYGSQFSPDSINNPFGAGSRFNTQPLYVSPGRQ